MAASMIQAVDDSSLNFHSLHCASAPPPAIAPSMCLPHVWLQEHLSPSAVAASKHKVKCRSLKRKRATSGCCLCSVIQIGGLVPGEQQASGASKIGDLFAAQSWIFFFFFCLPFLEWPLDGPLSKPWHKDFRGRFLFSNESHSFSF